MAIFSEAVNLTLKNEGGYVDDPNDAGGATNMGITQDDLDRAYGPGTFSVQQLTPAQAEAYYLTHFWTYLYNQIESQLVANKLFDLGVLFGTGEDVILLQQCLDHFNVVVDGNFGPHTLAAVNEDSELPLLAEYKQKVFAHIQVIVLAHPEDARFETGWENRVMS